MRVAAIGRTKILYDSIEAVSRAGHEIVMIVTSAESPEYTRGREDFRCLAASMNVPFFDTNKIASPKVIQTIQSHLPGVAISVNWMSLIPAEVLDMFEHGIVNAHAGDLPRFRGNATPSWAILSGEKAMTLCLHRMSPDLDAGPILKKRSLPIGSGTRVGELYDFIERSAPDMFAEVVSGLESGEVTPSPQAADPERSLRCFPRQPADGEIDWRHDAEQIDRLVRASSEPFAGAYTFLSEEKIVVWRAHPDRLPYPYLGVPGQVVDRRVGQGEVGVLTGDGVLVLEQVEMATDGRKRASDVLRSTRTRLGLNVAEQVLNLRRKLDELEARYADLEGGMVAPPGRPGRAS